MTFLIYLAELLDSVSHLFFVFSIFSFIAAAVSFNTIVDMLDNLSIFKKDWENKLSYKEKLSSDVEEECKNNLKNAKKWFRIFTLIGFSLITISTFLPSKKTVYLMMGSAYLNESSVPKKVMDVLNNKLDEILEEQEGKSN